jgi:hypothetical protein
MNATAIEYIWKAIQESERSDDLPFIDAMARWAPSARSYTPGRGSITAVGAAPLQANNNPLPAVTWPAL